MAQKASYIMVPRKFMIAILINALFTYILIVASFQYTNWVDRRSNGLWCGVVNTFNETYDKSPPTNPAGKILQVEFRRIGKGFKCE